MPAHGRLSKLRPHTFSIVAGVVFAVVLTGVALGPTLSHNGDPADAAAPSVASADDRDEAASRNMARAAPPSLRPTPTPSASRPAPKPSPTKATTRATTASKLPVPAGCGAYTGNRRIGCSLLPTFGFSTSQMPALDKMWTHESNWNERALNPSSGAYGIPQALPATKMATFGSDWRTNPATQIKWGLSYIKARYGTPNNAWSFWQAHHWY